ncbi:hypothetical protein E4U58_001856 [Claviceps cyperi]|nr:hypothetical protein E4U58_001856 [Claviceps cyperi]
MLAQLSSILREIHLMIGMMVQLFLRDTLPWSQTITPRSSTACDDSQLIQSGGADAKRVGLRATVEEVADKELPVGPSLESLKGADEATLESVAKGALWVMALMAEAGPPTKKRKGVPVSEELDEDEAVCQAERPGFE